MSHHLRLHHQFGCLIKHASYGFACNFLQVFPSLKFHSFSSSLSSSNMLLFLPSHVSPPTSGLHHWLVGLIKHCLWLIVAFIRRHKVPGCTCILYFLSYSTHFVLCGHTILRYFTKKDQMDKVKIKGVERVRH